MLIRHRRLVATLWVSALLLVSIIANAGIYKWTDEQGRQHFSDKPPRAADAEEVRLRPINTFQGVSIEGGDEMAGVGAAGQRSKRVVMYSASWCGVCRQAKRFFEEQGIPYKERDIEKNRMARTEFDRLNGRGVPLILVGGQRMNGFSAQSFLKLYK